MKTAPVALFVYNRPEHVKGLIDALSKNKLASNTELFIFSDGPKDSDDTEQVAEVRKICGLTVGFKDVIIREEKVNKGLATSIIDGISSILEKYDSVICLEDDLIPTVGFLDYMNNALSFYKDKNVFSISAYIPPINIPDDYKFSTCCIMRNSSWGWATWREKWKSVDWEVRSFKEFMQSDTLREEFEQAGNDTVMMLLKQQRGVINSWSIRFNYAAFKAGEPTVYPVASLISNAGVDGSGTNMRRSKKYNTPTTQSIDSALFTGDNKIDENIAKGFKSFYNTSLYRRTINKFKIWRYLSSI